MNNEYRDSYLSYFGNRQESILKYEADVLRYSLDIQNLVQDHGLSRLMVLDQIHTQAGIIVDDHLKENASWFALQGDFLITNQKNIALLILTADCVPLVLYDPVQHVIALVHAGWKGSYGGVVQTALQALQERYHTNVTDLICTFGPSARACCYEVSAQFIADFEKKYEMIDAAIMQKNDRWYFDNTLFLQHILKNYGILSRNICVDKAVCTICNVIYCSFRREKEFAGRQVTMVALR